MAAFAIVVILFIFYFVLGYAVLWFLSPGRQLRNMLLAPAVGSVVLDLPLFLLSRLNFPIKSVAIPVTVVLLGFLIYGLRRAWRRTPGRKYLPFALALIACLLNIGSPFFSFGMNWVSLSTDDMANYVLGSNRFLDHGYFDPPKASSFATNPNLSDYYWVLYVVDGVRAGAELIFAWLLKLTGLRGLNLFMPYIVTFQLSLISAAAGLACGRRRDRLAAVMCILLMGCSVMSTTGILMQFLGQTFGLSILVVSVWFFLRPVAWRGLRSWRYVVLGTLLVCGLFVVYPEAFPFLPLAYAVYFLVAFIQRRTVVLKPLPLLICLVAGVVLILNKYLFRALFFLQQQQAAGTSSNFGGYGAEVTFPGLFLPTAFAQFWGMIPLFVWPGEPVMSLSIAAGFILLILALAATFWLSWRSHPAAITTAVMSLLAVYLYSKRADYGVLKAAMFIQPFLLATLPAAWVRFIARDNKPLSPTTLPQSLLIFAPLLLGLVGLNTQRYNIDVSRGVGGGYVEIPWASSHKLGPELNALQANSSSTLLISDSSNPVLMKVEGDYFRGKSLLYPTKDIVHFAPNERPSDRNIEDPEGYRALARALSTFEPVAFDMRPEGPPKLNEFLNDTRVPTTSDAPARFASLLASTRSQTILNRRQAWQQPSQDVLTTSYTKARNHLIFIESDMGKSYFTHDRTKTSFFPSEQESTFKNGLLVNLGRYLLFRVINPSSPLRIVMEYSTSNRQGQYLHLPSPVVIGKDVAHFAAIGDGSARLISGPCEPQTIKGNHYVAVDMGVEPSFVTDRRTGLMRLFGAEIHKDPRRVVGYAREISAISEQDLARFRAPQSIDRLPGGLTHPDLFYSGIFEDGWLSQSSYSILTKRDRAEPICLRGAIPPEVSGGLNSSVDLSVDGKLVSTVKLQEGPFLVKAPTEEAPGQHRVDLHFSRTFPLGAVDLRQGGAYLDCLGFGATVCDEGSRKAGADIFQPADQVLGGTGFYAFETAEGAPFRWVHDRATIYLTSAATPALLYLDVEPGPAIGRSELSLTVRAGDRAIGTYSVKGRTNLAIPIPEDELGRSRFTEIHLLSSIRGQPKGSDPRTLTFRLFRAALQAKNALENSSDIVANGDVVALGHNWYGFENYKGERFRWVNNDATVTVTDVSKLGGGISLDLEPGPGVGGGPLVLRLLDSSGRQVQAAEARGRATLSLALPAGGAKAATYKIHVDGGGKKIPSDPRILNFRVFALYSNAHGEPQNSADIVYGGVKVAEDWFPYEAFRDQTFRWVNNNAKFTVPASLNSWRLTLEAEPGPGLGGKPSILRILDQSGRQVQATELKSRQTISLFLPPSKSIETYSLHIDGGGKKAPGDSRTLNFRVFQLGQSK